MLLGFGLVLTIDLQPAFFKEDLPEKVAARILQLYGSSINPYVFNTVERMAGGSNSCLVFLDSWHGKDHVLKELEMYSPLVGVGSYIVVEDTHASRKGHPVKWKYDDEGAMGAVREFMKDNDNFIIDESLEYNLMTFNPNGWIKRIK